MARPRDRFDRLVDRRPSWEELRRQGFRFVLVDGIVAGSTWGRPLSWVRSSGFLRGLARDRVCAGGRFALSLQRLYVWRLTAAVALSLHDQLARYLAMAALQYGTTAAITATLPDTLRVSHEVVYLPTVLVIAVTNFLVFRSRIFHAAIDPLHGYDHVP